MTDLPAYSCFVLDMDGTIVDTALDNARAANEALVDLGLEPLPAETVRSFIGGGVPRIMQRCLGDLAEDRLDDAVAAFMRHYEADPVSLSRPYPGVVETLTRITAEGGRIGICTQTPDHLAHDILAGTGLARFIGVVVGPESVTHRKPHPEPVLRVLAELGSGPEAAVLTGDAASDLQAARAAGVTACAATYGYGTTASLRAEDPAFEIATFPDLLRRVRVG
ncbi:HAD family hydrolase [Propionicicella superfundia]|uniref:HAD family hydrolase n=1 Tax=Propionicicella superfundia TaxID=348582 RepID=UPI00041B7B3F|nr:HAD-IA family hydrolase [Propionicicella superfundia]